MDVPVWIAQVGQWYVVQLTESGYALVVLESDAEAPGNDSPVWILIEGDPPGIEGFTVCNSSIDELIRAM